MQNNVPEWIQIAQPIAEIVLAAVAVIISIIALFQTKKQTQLSNKHQLFDRRLDKYTIIKDIISGYANAQPLITSKEFDINEYREAILITLLNNPLLEDSIVAVEDPLEMNNRKNFYEKTYILKQLFEETSIIFEGEESELISKFIMQFREFLEYLFFEHYYSEYKVQKELKKKLGIDNEDDETYFLLDRKKSSDVLPELQSIFEKVINSDAEGKLLKQIKL